VARERDSNMVIVEPTYVITQEVVQKLVAWARSSRVAILPRSALYTEGARRELERVGQQSKSIEIDLGLPYRLHSVGEGKVIVYDPPEGVVLSGEKDIRGAWRTFLTAMLSLAEVQAYCRLSDDRLSVIPVKRKGNELGLFVMNPTRRPIAADIIFPCDVEVTDLASTLAAGPGSTVPKNSETTAANRFSLDVPPCGILPLGVKGLDFSFEERSEARVFSEQSRGTESPAEVAQAAALATLPGFTGQNPGAGQGSGPQIEGAPPWK
jgi:hypothetical protein